MSDPFFADMTEISDFIFELFLDIWDAIMDNRILQLSFALFILGLVVAILRRIRHTYH